MRGMSRITGRPLEGTEHLEQSVNDILTTPIGTRVARRDYGSMLPLLMDQPMNAVGRARLFAATAMALSRWEPRIKVTSFALIATADGKAALTINGQRLDVPRPAALSLLVPFS
ncbi:MAG TPA: GPW/gp25 family protein [Sphingobium sp.]|uniref:GPW/gp25 family protein n=1 Tax=Sphingobium sp. TaxID=1912891 RepID=UPI002ED5D862